MNCGVAGTNYFNQIICVFKTLKHLEIVRQAISSWAVVVAQKVKRSLLLPEVLGSNPDIGEFLYWSIIYCELYYIEKTKRKKEKEAGIGPFLKTTSCVLMDEFTMHWKYQVWSPLMGLPSQFCLSNPALSI